MGWIGGQCGKHEVKIDTGLEKVLLGSREYLFRAEDGCLVGY